MFLWTLVACMSGPTSQTLIDELRVVAVVAEPPELRPGEDAYKTLGLGGENITNETIYDAIVDYPILMNRPIVVTEKGACICRPPERVNELLP